MENFNNLYLIKKMLLPLNINISTFKDIEGNEIDRDLLISNNIKELYLKLIPKAKLIYNSSKLTSLHKNCYSKQKNHSINFIRQILKCNNYKMKPKITSLGYTKNGKKIIKRSYIIESTKNNEKDVNTLKEIKICLNNIINKILIN